MATEDTRTLLEKDLDRALLALQLKQNDCEYYEKAYAGSNELPWIADRLKTIFKGLNTTDIRQNWCSPVVDACADRITLQGFRVKDEGTQKLLDTIIAQTDLLLEADDAHRHALVTGESFIIAWKDDETADIDLYYHEAHQVYICYETHKPNIARYAAKWWMDTDDYEISGEKIKCYLYIKLYYADKLYCYKTKSKVVDIQGLKSESFELDGEYGEIDNTFNVVPVFALRPDRRKAVSDLKDVIPLQNAINMLFINEIVSGEFNAYNQKYIISNASNIGALKSSPGAILDIPSADVGSGEQPTSVGEFAATDLANYSNSISTKVQAISAVSRTPLHYFIPGQGGVPSGEALIALEAPLNKKAQDRIDRFSVVWKKIAVFLLQLSGVVIAPEDVTVDFAKPETVQPRTVAEIRKMNVDAGIPLTSTLRLEGMEEAEIERIKAEKEESEEAAISNAIRSFNAGAGEVENDKQEKQPNTPRDRTKA